MITFFDYDGEWLVAPLIARENDEANPILVCSITDEYQNYRVCPDTYEVVDIPWYQIYTDRLKLLKKIETYFIYEITDLEAYHAIWLRLSEDYSIASYVFAADCDLGQLEILLCEKPFLDSLDFRSIAKWSYWQQFGGGADEHFAYYVSQDSTQMTRFKYYLTEEQYKKRYQNICHFGLDQYERANFITQLSDNNNPLFCLYKKALNSVLNIETKEAHRTWWVSYNEVRESEYDDEDYENFLFHKKEVCELLQEIDAIRPYEQFIKGNYCYKVIPIDSWEQLKDLWDNCDTTDFIEGIFSADTDIASLKQQILYKDAYIQPESLTKLGSWSIARIRDGFYSSMAMLYTERKDYLEKYLDKQSSTYENLPVNDKARHYR